MKTKSTLRLTISSMLAALSLAIPLLLAGTVSIVIGPFTATPASHVPTFLSALFGPGTAALVGVASALGFFVKLGPLVGLRAAMHVPTGVAASLMLRRGASYPLALLLTAPLHALLETIVALAYGFQFKHALFVVGLGTLVHHAVDSAIAITLWGSLRRAIGDLRTT